MTPLAPPLDQPPYALDAAARAQLLGHGVAELTRHHAAHCPPYRAMLAGLGFDPEATEGRPVADYPFLPARLFKLMTLTSVAEGEVVKVLTSSGTSSQTPSRIYLDRATAALQARVLNRIVQSFIGPKRLPLLVIDAPATVRDRARLSARAAGINGFSIFGRGVTFALNDALELDRAVVDAFLERHAGEPLLLFGFTSIVYQQLIEPLRASGERLALDQAILIHGGGWKKLAERAVDNATFKAQLLEATGIHRVANYYGMVEQTGSIFMECAAGRLHSSIYSEVLVRRPDFSLAEPGERGLVQLVSLLPRSYPGHLLLTEDEGTVDAPDSCPCGRLGTTFTIHGRAAQAELRGCSDIDRPR